MFTGGYRWASIFWFHDIFFGQTAMAQRTGMYGIFHTRCLNPIEHVRAGLTEKL